MRIAKDITLTDSERTTLQKWSRGRSTPTLLVVRAKIVLAAADGRRSDEIAAELGCTPRTVGTWRNRFAKERLAGMPRHRHQEWLKFLKKIDAESPVDLQLHLIVDNYATHKHPKVEAWLKRHPRFHIHFTPTSSSWLNVIERWFREITQKRIRRGVFHSVPQLIDAIQSFIAEHNRSPQSFKWTAKAADILEKVHRARAALDKVPSA
jgi:transposase